MSRVRLQQLVSSKLQLGRQSLRRNLHLSLLETEDHLLPSCRCYEPCSRGLHGGWGETKRNCEQDCRSKRGGKRGRWRGRGAADQAIPRSAGRIPEKYTLSDHGGGVLFSLTSLPSLPGVAVSVWYLGDHNAVPRSGHFRLTE